MVAFPTDADILADIGCVMDLQIRLPYHQMPYTLFNPKLVFDYSANVDSSLDRNDSTRAPKLQYRLCTVSSGLAYSLLSSLVAYSRQSLNPKTHDQAVCYLELFIRPRVSPRVPDTRMNTCIIASSCQVHVHSATHCIFGAKIK